MFPCGPIVDELMQAVDYVGEDDREKCLRSMNIAYFDLIPLVSWALLRKSMTATPTSDGLVVLPANLAGVDAIYTDNYFFYPREKANASQDNLSDPVYKWFVNSVTRAPLVYKRGITITQGATSFTTTEAISTDYIGEFLQIAGQLGFYELASATTIEETYMGKNIQNGWYQVRPQGTKQIKLVDCQNDPYTDSVTIDYWAFPVPLYADSDMVLLPTMDVLYYRTLVRLMRLKENESRARTFTPEYREALAESKQANPRYICPAFTQDSYGSPQSWGITDDI